MSFAIVSGTISYGLGQVQRLKMQKNSPGDVLSFYGQNSTDNYVYDMEGVTRTITLSGIYSTSDGTLTTFIDNIEALIDGAQGDTSGLSFTSGASDVPASKTFTVHLEEFDYEWDVGVQGEISYTIKLLERTSSQ